MYLMKRVMVVVAKHSAFEADILDTRVTRTATDREVTACDGDLQKLA
jgi:hypothetical protein